MAADIPYTEGFANIVIAGATDTIKDNKKWFKIEVNNVRTGARGDNSMIQTSTNT